MLCCLECELCALAIPANTSERHAELLQAGGKAEFKRGAILEYHDISVSNFAETAKFIRGNALWNLMIIPFCQEPVAEGGIFSSARSAFAKQILEWKNQGHKLYLHGYKHKADLTLKRSLFGRFALRLTNGEAEFAGLAKADLERTLDLALAEWNELAKYEKIGFPDGFVAPAWYGSSALFFACKKRGFENYESRFVMWNKKSGAKLSVPFSVAGLPKIFAFFVKKCEGAYLRVLSLVKFLPIAKIVRHPTD